ncbi:MAG: hypothetical protein R2792_03800 [Saprospiraceae bacterium]
MEQAINQVNEEAHLGTIPTVQAKRNRESCARAILYPDATSSSTAGGRYVEIQKVAAEQLRSSLQLQQPAQCSG